MYTIIHGRFRHWTRVFYAMEIGRNAVDWAFDLEIRLVLQL